MSRLTYLVCDLRSGLVLDELPLGADEITCTVAREESQQFQLNVLDEACPDDWIGLVIPGKTMIVAVTDTGEPVLGWALINTDIGGAQVPLSCATLEHCLTRVNVATIEEFSIDEGELMGLIAAKMADTHGFVVEAAPTGKIVDDAFYEEEEDQSIFTALSERMAGEDGPEWRIFLRWADETHKHLEKVIDSGPGVGVDRADAVFDLDADGRGNVDDYQRGHSYSIERGATQIIGTSEGSGDSRPMSQTYVSALTIQQPLPWPIWESRPSFTGLDAPSVDDPDAELERRARGTLRRRAAGAKIWSVQGGQEAPRPGYDFNPGDTVHVDIAPQGKRDPEGGVFAARVIGWTWNTVSDAVTPILWEDEEEAIS